MGSIFFILGGELFAYSDSMKLFKLLVNGYPEPWQWHWTGLGPEEQARVERERDQPEEQEMTFSQKLNLVGFIGDNSSQQSTMNIKIQIITEYQQYEGVVYMRERQFDGPFSEWEKTPLSSLPYLSPNQAGESEHP